MSAHMTGAHNRIIQTAALAMSGCLFIAFGAPARADVTVKGDKTVQTLIGAALKKTYSMSFRMKTTAKGSSGSLTMVMEWVPPDRQHVTEQGASPAQAGIPASSMRMESIQVGDKTATRSSLSTTPGEWTCYAGQKPPDNPLRDSTSTSGTGTFEFSRGPDTVIEGTPVHAYGINQISPPPRYKQVVYVGTQTGLLRRVVGTQPGKPDEAVIDYYDYGAPIHITLPACKTTKP